MIEKIQNLIEDNTSLEVTRQQVMMFLGILVALVFLIIFVMVKSSNGVKKDPEGYVAPKATTVDPIHVSGDK